MKEFPEIENAKQYVEKAWDFLGSPNNGTLVRNRANGDQIFYNPEINTFGVKNSHGVPRTLFRPDPKIHKYNNNLEYFYGY